MQKQANYIINHLMQIQIKPVKLREIQSKYGW